MVGFLRKLKDRIFGAEGGRARNRTIRREQATLRRWSERGNSDRFGV